MIGDAEVVVVIDGLVVAFGVVGVVEVVGPSVVVTLNVVFVVVIIGGVILDVGLNGVVVVVGTSVVVTLNVVVVVVIIG